MATLTPKLSEAQKRLLFEIVDGDVVTIWEGYKPARALVSRGFSEFIVHKITYPSIRPTNRGREVAALLRGEVAS